jgi:hypothetical protein
MTRLGKKQYLMERRFENMISYHLKTTYSKLRDFLQGLRNMRKSIKIIDCICGLLSKSLSATDPHFL